MLATAIVPVLMLVVGALVYGLSSNPKVAELGRCCAFAGLIGLAIEFAHRGVAIP